MATPSRCRAYELPGGSHHPVQNRILAALPEEEYQRVFPRLELVPLEFKQVLYEANAPIQFGYFPNSGVVSVIATMRDGASVEVGIVGNEGFVGTPILHGVKATPHRTIVQVAGNALRVEAEALERIVSRTPILELILRRFAQAEAFQLAQNAACNRLHQADERLARWLLMAQDRAGSDLLPLTHEFLAEMLGSWRCTVTAAARTLQKAGLIEYSRGRVKVLDRRGLEKAACECHRSTKQLERLAFL